MADESRSALQVALVAEEGKHRSLLQGLLRQHQLDVVTCLALNDLSEDTLHQLSVDVILIDLVEEPEESALDFMMENAPAPILFSESQMSTGKGWGEKLVHKLVALAGDGRVADSVELTPPAELTPLEVTPEPVTPKPTLKIVAEPEVQANVEARVEAKVEVKAAVEAKAAAEVDTRPQATIAVCVLGASIGGPDAVKKFLSLLSEDIPITFILAQHIGMGFDHRLANQLNRATRLDVRMAQAGDKLKYGEVLVVPTKGRLAVDSLGEVSISDTPWSGPYNPTINDVMACVAENFGSLASAILFSGMGNDGASGAQEVFSVGGQVWAQEESSCVISSIPDSARQRGVVSYSGTPVQLAERLMQQCRRQVANGV